MAPKRKTMADFERENYPEHARMLGNPADDEDFSWDYELDEALRAQAAAQLRRRGQSPAPFRASSRPSGRDPDVKQELLTEDEFRWTGYVAAGSAFDMFSSSLVSLIGFIYGYRTHSISLACLGVQCLAHMMTSVLLAIRFTSERRLHRWAKHHQAIAQGDEASKSDSDRDQNVEDAAEMLKKQRRASIGREQGIHVSMGVVMLLTSLALAFGAAYKLDKWNTWYQDHAHIDREAQLATEGLAWYGFSVYILQAIFRATAACKMRRDILWHAFSASFVSVLFLLVLGISASYQKEWSWRAEPFAAIILSLATFIEGLRLLVFFSEDLEMRMSFDPRA